MLGLACLLLLYCHGTQVPVEFCTVPAYHRPQLFRENHRGFEYSPFSTNQLYLSILTIYLSIHFLSPWMSLRILNPFTGWTNSYFWSSLLVMFYTQRQGNCSSRKIFSFLNFASCGKVESKRYLWLLLYACWNCPTNFKLIIPVKLGTI